MYLYDGRTDTKKQYAMMIICMIMGVAIGAYFSTGRVITVADTDTVMMGAQETFTGSNANNLYYSLTGRFFADDGGLYDRCTRRIFDVGTLEVNILSYEISITGEADALMFILRESGNLTDYVILDQFKRTGTIESEIGIVQGYDIIIIVFYLDVRTVVISGILS